MNPHECTRTSVIVRTVGHCLCEVDRRGWIWFGKVTLPPFSFFSHIFFPFKPYLSPSSRLFSLWNQKLVQNSVQPASQLFESYSTVFISRRRERQRNLQRNAIASNFIFIFSF
ncbi:hypothetical protein LguiB_005679 [Lonicera macranthoides]